MNKSDLKTGMIVTTRNDSKWVVMLDCDIDRGDCRMLLSMFSDGSFTGQRNPLDNYNYDLSWRGEFIDTESDFDIIMVEKGIVNQSGGLKVVWLNNPANRS